ncbi:endolytic transglycosylase MltG [Aquibacillus sediminis]|uniref:endolytic transglycosylase MltG n=1 Tax=Aquibacillus sediminis TaxID=2574734 RepID=UPI001108C451|nr:endolytic transglycosylase MltG [Aquibacillus sediminis]
MSDSNDNQPNTNKSKQEHGNDVQQQLQERGYEASLVRKIVSIVLIVLVTVIVVGGVSAFLYIKSALEPVDPDDDREINVEIPLGSSSSRIASLLEENNIINNATLYRFYIKFNNVAQFQAGEYTLSPSMTLEEITDLLQEGKVLQDPVLQVTIPEGKTIEQIAELYSEKANIDKQAFLDKLSDDNYIKDLMEQYPAILTEDILDPDIHTPLEGYLFASTYQFYEEEPSVETIVSKMLDKTEDILTPYLNDINALDNLTVHDVVTFASLVENEARSIDHRKRIAGVFYNRLEEGMKLQTDPTVAYALGEHLDRTLYDHLEVESPYNTYQVEGLPVGPISNFAENSIQAVIEPTETEAMYFLYADGEIYYSETYSEHQQKIAQYRNG